MFPLLLLRGGYEIHLCFVIKWRSQCAPNSPVLSVDARCYQATHFDDEKGDFARTAISFIQVERIM